MALTKHEQGFEVNIRTRSKTKHNDRSNPCLQNEALHTRTQHPDTYLQRLARTNAFDNL